MGTAAGPSGIGAGSHHRLLDRPGELTDLRQVQPLIPRRLQVAQSEQGLLDTDGTARGRLGELNHLEPGGRAASGGRSGSGCPCRPAQVAGNDQQAQNHVCAFERPRRNDYPRMSSLSWSYPPISHVAVTGPIAVLGPCILTDLPLPFQTYFLPRHDHLRLCRRGRTLFERPVERVADQDQLPGVERLGRDNTPRRGNGRRTAPRKTPWARETRGDRAPPPAPSVAVMPCLSRAGHHCVLFGSRRLAASKLAMWNPTAPSTNSNASTYFFTLYQPQ